MAPKRDLDTARQWGREILKTHELEEFTSSSEDAIVPVIDTTQIQADAQPRKMSISGIMNTAIQAGIVAPGGGGGSSASGIAAGSGIYITQSGELQVINAEETLVSGVVAGSGIYITQDGSNQVINAEETLISGVVAGSGISITQSGDLQVINSTLPAASGDGTALVYANGDWVAGPVIGGVEYNVGDPYFADVELLLYGEGAEGGTVFTDSSNNSTTVTRQGLASTTQLQTDPFGDSNGVIVLDPATSDYLTVPSTNFQFGTDDFTFETFFRPTAVGGLIRTIIAFPEGDLGSSLSTLRVEVNGQRLRLAMADQALNSWSVLVTGNTNLVTGQWYHVAVGRNGVNATLYLDGAVEIQTTSVPATMGTTTGIDGRIGFNTAADPQYLSGYISNLRITKGVRRYTSPFTPPTSKFATSGAAASIPYSVGLHEDVDITTTPPTDGQSLVWASGVSALVPGTRVKSDTTLAGAGASGVSNLVTISQTDYDALVTPNADTIYFIV